MKMKTKLSMSLAAAILLPALIFLLFVVLLLTQHVSWLNRNFGMNETFQEMWHNDALYTVGEATIEANAVLSYIMADHPEKMEDLEFLAEFNDSLSEKKSYLIICRESEVIFWGDTQPQSSAGSLKPEGDTEEALYWNENLQAFVRQITFSYADGTAGTAYIATHSNQLVPRIQNTFAQFLIAAIFILILVMVTMSYFLYRSYYKPLLHLRVAAQNVAKGNLDYVIYTKQKDEIGDLYQSFEAIRQRLLESAERQITDESSSKELITNISHDLKTPITSIKGYVEGIMDGVADTPEKMERYIHTIYNKTKDMDRLIDELTYYSKIDTNRIPYTFSKLDIVGYFQDCAEELSMDLSADGVEFEYEEQCRSPILVIADPEQMKKVVNNIVGNSIKYMDKENPKIILRIYEDKKNVYVEIEDNGKGIANGDLEHIFDRFYRTDSARGSSTGGSGIGLSICKKIIEDHGGKIVARSIEGQGTVMCFSLVKHKEDKRR